MVRHKPHRGPKARVRKRSLSGVLYDIFFSLFSNIPSNIKSIAEFDAPLFFHTASVCLSQYHLSRNDGQPRYPTKLPGGKAQQFRVGTSMADDMKTMGYNGEVGYESFLYPSELSMKKLLRFLVDKLPKPENETRADSDSTQSTGGLVDIKRVLKQWTSQKWNPLGYAGAHQPAQFGIRTIPVSIPNSETSNKAAAEYYNQRQPIVAKQVPSFGSLFPSLLESHSLELVRKENIVDEFDRKQRNQEAMARIRNLVKGAFTGAQRAHEAYLASARMNGDLSLFAANQGGVSGRSAFGRKEFFENDKTETSSAGIGGAGVGVGGDQQSIEEREAALKAERERQLLELQSQLDELLQSQRTIDSKSDLLQTQTRQLENELSKLVLTSRELEDAYLVKKRTLDLLPDAANNLVELQKLVATSSTRLVELGKEWENHRIPLVNKLRRARQLFAERKEEIGQKIEMIKRIREEMKEKANDLREKEKLSKVLTDELNSLPKSINRQIYVKRIMDLMKNIDKQNAAIKAVLKDVKQVQKDINLTSESSKRSFAVADEVVFQSAKKNPKDDAMTKTYKYVVTLREGFVELVAGVEQKGKIENEIMSLQTQIDDIEARNTNLNMERIQSDLAQVKAENKQLTAQLKAAAK